MPFQLPTFGFKFRSKKNASKVEHPSIVPPESVADSQDIFSPSPLSIITGTQLEERVRSIKEYIDKYRWLELQPEADEAIRDIINEAIVVDKTETPIEVNLDKTDFSDSIKKKIQEEFENILDLLSFSEEGSTIFRRWYVDGRLTYQILIDENNTKTGIQELRYLDPRQLQKVREIKTEKDKNGIEVIKEIIEYYQYESPLTPQNAAGVTIEKASSGYGTQTIALSPDSIIYVPSGLTDRSKQITVSHLHKSIKPMNILRMIEDSAVIYRVARAPERRVFYVDVGNLPRNKAQEHLKDIMNQYRNRTIYDSTTGELKNDKRIMSILEDFWLPRREGSSAAEISTLAGGQNLGQIEDIIFFERKLYKSLNVPVSRLDTETRFSFGRPTEITRDELRFHRFIGSLQCRFNTLFLVALKIQLKLKETITDDEWDANEQRILFDYNEDSYFSELKETEIINARLNTLHDATNYTGSENGGYYSKTWAKKHILHQSDDDIKTIKKEIEEEEKQDKPDGDETPESDGLHDNSNNKQRKPPWQN